MAAETMEFSMGGGEVSEFTPQLRWVPNGRFGIYPHETQKLQQAHRIYVVDKDGRRWGSRMEWRDVPFEPNPTP